MTRECYRYCTLYHREVTILCCHVQWCPVILIPNHQVHLCPLHMALTKSSFA